MFTTSSSRGSSVDRGYYDSFSYGRDPQPVPPNPLQSFGSNQNSRWDYQNEVKEDLRSSIGKPD